MRADVRPVNIVTPPRLVPYPSLRISLPNAS